MLEDLEMQSGTVYDSELSETSANAVQNKVITEELGKKVNKTNMATINGKSLIEGGNIVIEGGGQVTVDSALSTTSENPVQNKVITEELNKKANTHGTYPLLVSGDLAGRGESVPAEFGFRASGGKSIKDGRAYIKRIKGNSVVWNQRVDTITSQDCDLSENGNLLTITPQGGFPGVTTAAPMPFVIGHKYICVSYRLGGGRLMINCDGYDGDTNVVFTAQKGQNGAVIYDYDETEQFTITRPIIVDLTKMFQAGNEPSTIEEFNSRVATLGIDMYAYNEGEVIHCNTERIKSVGDNAFNGVWYQGGVSDNDGSINTTQSDNLHTDTFRVIGGETYCSQYDGADLYIKGFFFDKSGAFIGSSDFDVLPGTKKWVAPINADSVRMRIFNGVGNITPSQAPNVMIRLDHSGWKSNTGVGYEPYWQDTLPLPIIRKYFPDGMKKAGAAHDEIRFNKATQKWEYSKERIKSVDLGTLSWYYTADFGGYYSDMLYTANTDFGGICSAYPFVGKYINVNDKEMGGIFGQCILIKDSAYTDAAALKASLQDVILYYESNDWEWVELDEADQNFRDYYQVADFGTEQSQSNVPSAAFSADIIYQFNAVDMIREHEMEINELQSIIATMQAQLTSLINQ